MTPGGTRSSSQANPDRTVTFSGRDEVVNVEQEPRPAVATGDQSASSTLASELRRVGRLERRVNRLDRRTRENQARQQLSQARLQLPSGRQIRATPLNLETAIPNQVTRENYAGPVQQVAHPFPPDPPHVPRPDSAQLAEAHANFAKNGSQVCCASA